MVYAIIEHFLTTEGQHYFTEWIAETRKVVQPFTGFVKLAQLHQEQLPKRCLLLLQFEQKEQLLYWAKSETHNTYLARLKPFMLQKQKTALYESY